MIVHKIDPLTLVGGANLGPSDLKIAQKFAPLFIAADGGADHLLSAGLKPLAVIGDLDSISSKARDAYGDVLHRVEDQNTTDFDKVLAEVSGPYLLACGFLGGRLDHMMAVLRTLAVKKDKRVILISEDDAAFMMPAEELRLTLDVGCRVALLPLGECHVKSAGLRWDVDGRMMPTGAISSSNEAAQTDVVINANGPLLVTVPVAALAAVIEAIQA